MNLTLTNTTADPEAIGDPEGTWTDVLQSNTPYEYDNDEAVDVLIIGDKPDTREQFARAAEVVSETVRKLLALIAQRKKVGHHEVRLEEHVCVIIANHGGHAVRVILGNGVDDITIEPATSAACSAKGYLELRELGSVAQPGGTPD